VDPKLCNTTECGPAPLSNVLICPDGINYQGPGPCERNSAGICGYNWLNCPNPATNKSANATLCTYSECGPAPLAALKICSDGKNYEGPGPCVRRTDGTCGYTWLTCPNITGGGDCSSTINSGPTGSSYYEDCNICVCDGGAYKCSFSNCLNGSCPCPSVSTDYKTAVCDNGFLSGVLLCSMVNGSCASHLAKCPVTFNFTVSAKVGGSVDLDVIKNLTCSALKISCDSVVIDQISNVGGKVTFKVQVAENSIDQSNQQASYDTLSSSYASEYVVQDSGTGTGSGSSSGVALFISSVLLIVTLLF